METYVVRTWTPGVDEPPGQEPLRGTVQHVASGNEVPFIGARALLEFFAAEHHDRVSPQEEQE